MVCYKCGNEMKLCDKFCPKCGTPFSYEAPPGKGMIVFKRKSRIGFALKIHLYLDDIKIGMLKNNSEICYPVDFGSHKITGHLRTGKKESVVLEFSAERKIAILDCWVEMSERFTIRLAGNVKFRVV